MRTTTCSLLLITILAACGSDATGPGRVAGLYRLASVNGQPLPWSSPPSLGFCCLAIAHGELELRANGSYGLGIGGSDGWLEEGDFRVTDTAVRLLPPPGAPPETTTVTLAGDSAVIQRAVRLVFKRISPPNAIAPGPFVLTAVNGRTSLVELDTTMNDQRFVARVRYDTITFMDRIFYRRHRRHELVRYLSNGDSVKGDFEFTIFGAHDVATGMVILRNYNRMPNGRGRDTLWTVDNDLVRRTQLITGLQEDRYARR